ncbi:MAG: PqqD family protein [Acetatifactor sp.]|nr:PqqD family protein [Acetatifactor sp.]
MRYQLRYAAGMYWLLDIEQEGVPYKRPLSMNEVGARIWEMTEKGFTREQIVESLCGEYQAERELVESDVERFLAQLAEYGVE